MLMAKVCLFDSSLRRLLEVGSNTIIVCNIPLCFSFTFFTFHFFTFFFLGFIVFFSWFSLYFTPSTLFTFLFPFPSFSYTYIHLINDLTLLPPSSLHPYPHPQNLHPFAPVSFRYDGRYILETPMNLKPIFYHSFILLPFLLYTTNSIPVHMLDIYCPFLKKFILFRLTSLPSFLLLYISTAGSSVQYYYPILCTILCA